MRMEPNKENIRLWVEWLRTKGLRQETGALAVREREEQGWGYCCLGVACEVARASGLELKVEVEDDPFAEALRRQRKKYDGVEDVLPASVMRWLGIGTEDPLVSWAEAERGVEQHLSSLNDDERWDFARIADAIEYTFLREEDDDDALSNGETSA